MIRMAQRGFWNRPLRSCLIAALLSLCVPAGAQELASGLSTDLIQITSNFNGTDIVLFGAIEATGETTPNNDQDLVIVIRGPPVDMTVRRKARVFGIWMNREEVQLSGMPGYYFLASTRPLDDIASLATLQRFRLGTANLESMVRSQIDPADLGEFRAAGSVLHLEGQLRSPLRGHRDPHCRIPQFHPLWAVGRHQQGEHL